MKRSAAWANRAMWAAAIVSAIWASSAACAESAKAAAPPAACPTGATTQPALETLDTYKCWFQCTTCGEKMCATRVEVMKYLKDHQLLEGLRTGKMPVLDCPKCKTQTMAAMTRCPRCRTWMSFKFDPTTRTRQGICPACGADLAKERRTGGAMEQPTTQPTKKRTISVLQPDGQPAAGAAVAIATAAQPAFWMEGEIRQMGTGETPQTNALGQATIDEPQGTYIAYVGHESGCAELRSDAMRTISTIQLQPWGTLEGAMYAGSKPVPWTHIALCPADSRRSMDPWCLFNYDVKTDRNGKFRLTKLFPGDWYVGRIVMYGKTGTDTQETCVTIEPGKTATAIVGGSGRPVTGQVELPQDADVQFGSFTIRTAYLPPDPPVGQPMSRDEVRTWELTSPEYRTYLQTHRSYSFKLNSDGTFRVADIPAGVYTLDISLCDPPSEREYGNGRTYAGLQHEFTVPEMPGGRSGQAFDLGTLTFEMIQPRQAPPTTPSSATSKPSSGVDMNRKIPFLCNKCGNVERVTIRELREMNKTMPMGPMDPPKVDCTKCGGKKTAMQAIECPECKNVFIISMDPAKGTYNDKCPKCGISYAEAWKKHMRSKSATTQSAATPAHPTISDLPTRVGEMAADFEAKTPDGKTIKLSDYRGKFVLLDFWATWCGPCVREMPNIRETFAKFGGDRLAVVSVSVDADETAWKAYVAKKKLDWVQGLLGDRSKKPIPASYGVRGIPAIFLIGPDGKIVADHLRGSSIMEAVDRALAAEAK